MDAPDSESELEDRLSRPSEAVVETISDVCGDVLILGAGGKMGPTMARMVRRALDTAGNPARVIAVSRFSNLAAKTILQDNGIDAIECDLLVREGVMRLPAASNVFYMMGRKFGTTESPALTWAVNTIGPALAAERFADSRIVVFSTGCVYADSEIRSGGSREEEALEPIGEYANSCVARERTFEHFSIRNGTPIILVRLNYAVDLRYGVLVDLARRVMTGEPIDLTTGYVNVIWQADACAMAIRCLFHASSPPFVLNVTGPETLSVRSAAMRFGEILGRSPVFEGSESDTALLSDASRSVALFGAPLVSADTLIRWQAEWLMEGGRTLDRPTHFQSRHGRF